MDDSQRRRARADEDDQARNRRRRTNPNDGVQAVEEDDRVVVMTGDDDARLHLSLRPPTSSYTSQILPPLPFALPLPPRFASPQPYWPPPYLASSSSLSNSPYQTPIPPPSFDFVPLERPAVEPRRIYRSSQSSRNRKDDTIPPPYPWATNKRGAIQTLENLESKQITAITGDVQCKHCEKVYQISYNLREKFSEVENVFATLKRIMRERAPAFWTNPEPLRCELCGRDKAVKPVIAERKSQINWLFLLLGQMLGYCTLEQLKNFCKHCKSHRTGAKDRVLYLTYLGLCKMLQPNRDLFNRDTSR